MTANEGQRRPVTKAHPLACNCKSGWVSAFGREYTYSLACNCETGWVSFILFFYVNKRTTTTTSHVGSSLTSTSICTHNNNDKSPPPCMQLQAGVGFFLQT